MGAAAPSGVGGLTHAQSQLTWLRSLPGLEPAANLAAALTRA